MAKKYHSYGIKYVADRGKHLLLSGRFIIPSDVNDSMLSDLISIFKLLPVTEIPCPDSGFRPRRLEFLRESGNSFSLILAENINILGICRQVRDLFINNNKSPIACIKLIGEFWQNIYFELLPTDKTIVPGRDSRGVTGKQLYYKGLFKYEVDVPFRPGPPPIKTEIILPFRMATAVVDQPPEDYDTAISNCLEEVETIACPPNYQCVPRCYSIISAVHQEGSAFDAQNPFKSAVKQSLKIPISSREAIEYIEPVPAYPDLANDIFVCGRELVLIPSTICISYQGESCNFVHKYL